MGNYLSRMYNSTSQSATPPEKNPNRVSGGLRAQGHDAFTMLGEDGVERKIPTQQYVNSLEEKVKRLQEQTGLLERKLARQDTNVQRLAAIVDQKLKR